MPFNIKFYFKIVRWTACGGVRLAFGANYGNQIISGPFVSGLNFASKNSLAGGCRGGGVRRKL